MVTIQCFCWTIYGYVVNDVSTGVNNIVGFFLGLTQLSLIGFYGNKRAAAAAALASNKSETPKSSTLKSLSADSGGANASVVD